MLSAPLLALVAALGGGPDIPDDPDGVEFSADAEARALAVVRARCTECHVAPDPAGELDLAALASAPGVDPDAWRRVRSALRAGEMPPAWFDERPGAAEVEAVLAWVEARFPAPDPEPEQKRATTLRRLNRRELGHALVDLFGVDAALADELPADGVSHGFDVVGATLTLAPSQLETLLALAEEVAFAALPPPGSGDRDVRRVPASELETGRGNRYAEGRGAVVLSSNGAVATTLGLERAGLYEVRILAGEQHAGPAHARMDLRVDGRRVERFEVAAPAGDPVPHAARVRLEPGARRLEVAFVNDYYEPEDPDPENRDRNLHVREVEVAGPLDAPSRTPFEERANPDGRTAREVLAELAPLVWRGPVEADELDRLAAVADEEATERERLRGALVGLLASPRFLFRPEPVEGGALAAHRVATRLAAFLWCSVPDAGLLAEGSELLAPAGRRSAARRMLRDPRASRFAREFTAQWLQLGRLASHAPDPGRFPDYDDELADAMRAEPARLFEAVLREGRATSELLDADFTFANERLARHYGLPAVRGPELRRVPVPAHLADRRGGLLGQAGPLTASSHPGRTSPVLRGKWVLEALLASPPPPPPPGVGALDESPAAGAEASLRERLEHHRSDSACASCHAPMDGLGFALEPYDAVGAWRERDGPHPIDARGTLPGGVEIDGPAGLRDHLLAEDRFARGLARHLATFALGRGLGAADRAELDALVDALGPDPALAELVAGIAGLEAFGRR